jgi:hypothetical protein
MVFPMPDQKSEQIWYRLGQIIFVRSLWAYRNTPHESTGEKPSFLLVGIDCRGPTEAAFLPPNLIEPAELNDYYEEVIKTCPLHVNLL